MGLARAEVKREREWKRSGNPVIDLPSQEKNQY